MFLSQALDFLLQNSRRLHFARCSPLPVGGAFHTPLMESAYEPLKDVLRQVEVWRPLSLTSVHYLFQMSKILGHLENKCLFYQVQKGFIKKNVTLL